MARLAAVCKDCTPPKRHLHCHSTCKEYLEARAQYEIDTSKERKAKKAIEVADSVSFLLKRS